MQNTLWLQKEIILQGLRHGRQGYEVEALSAQPSANGAAAQMLQAARGARQGQQGRVEGPVRLRGRGVSLCVGGPRPPPRQETPPGTGPRRSTAPVRRPPPGRSVRFSQAQFPPLRPCEPRFGGFQKIQVVALSLFCPVPPHSPTSADPKGARDSGMKHEGNFLETSGNNAVTLRAPSRLWTAQGVA